MSNKNDVNFTEELIKLLNKNKPSKAVEKKRGRKPKNKFVKFVEEYQKNKK